MRNFMSKFSLGSVGDIFSGGLSAVGNFFNSGNLSSNGISSLLMAGAGAYTGNPALMTTGIVGLGQDYLNGQVNMAQARALSDMKLDRELQLADKELSVNSQLQNEAFRYNQQLAEQDYQRNIEMWNYQNEYNSPTQQMARLRAAGLNPNLVYGGGNVSGLTTSNAPEMSSATYSPAQYRAPSYEALRLSKVSSYQQLENQALQNEKIRQNIKLAERDADRSDRIADAQIENLKSMYGLRDAELGVRHGEVTARQQEVKEQNAWRRYQDDLDAYERNIKSLPYGLRQDYEKKHRKPMYMDYL